MCRSVAGIVLAIRPAVQRKLVVAWVLVSGCAEPFEDPYCGNGEPDPNEECDEPGTAYCDMRCKLIPVGMPVHWSFETLSGDSKMPCLPGDPDVQIHLRETGTGYRADFSAPCASGQAPVMAKPGYYDFWITSGVERVYTSRRFRTTNTGIPTLVTYTDAGYVEAWAYYADAEDKHWCNPPGATSVRFVVDGVPDATYVCNSYNVIGPFSEGTHSLYAEGLDAGMNVVATSSSIDVDVVGGATMNNVTMVFSQ